jgi:hypothetical protein
MIDACRIALAKLSLRLFRSVGVTDDKGTWWGSGPPGVLGAFKSSGLAILQWYRYSKCSSRCPSTSVSNSIIPFRRFRSAAIASIFLDDIYPVSRQFSLGMLTNTWGKIRNVLPLHGAWKLLESIGIRVIFGSIMRSKTRRNIPILRSSADTADNGCSNLVFSETLN